MRPVGILSTALLASVVLCGTDARAQLPNPAEVRIKNLTFGGSGCKRSNTSVAMAPDAHAFTVVYDAFLVEAGPGTSNGQAKRNCQLHFTVDVPRGFTFAVNVVDNQGFANIAAGARGLLQTVYHFRGPEPPGPSWRSIVGPTVVDWRFRDEVDPSAIEVAPCHGRKSVNIHTRLQLEKGTSTDASFMSMDSLDSEISQRFELAWRRCN